MNHHFRTWCHDEMFGNRRRVVFFPQSIPSLSFISSVNTNQFEKKPTTTKKSLDRAKILLDHLMHMYLLHCPFALCGRWVWKLGRCRSPACADKYFREKNFASSLCISSLCPLLSHTCAYSTDANTHTQSWRQAVLEGCSRQVTFSSHSHAWDKLRRSREVKEECTSNESNV